jgi:hypothetical protein
MKFVIPIVEGHGEMDAVPVLLRRIATELAASYVDVGRPIKVHSGSFLKDTVEFRRHILLASGKAADRRGIVLILLDCEDACPAILGPEILRRAQAIRGDVEFVVSLAYREYETWFLFAAESMRGLRGLPDDLTAHPNPESPRDAKGWLRDQMKRKYIEVEDQPALTARFDLTLARQSSSFDRLVRKLLIHLG